MRPPALLAAVAATALVLAGCGSPRPMQYSQAALPDAAPAGKALVVFHAPSPSIRDTYLWDGTDLIGQVWGMTVYAHACEPGTHHFLGRAGSDSVVTADLAAGKVYDIVLDYTVGYGYGGMHSASRLVPLTKAEPRRAEIPTWLQRERPLVWSPDNPVAVDEWVAKEKARTQKILDKFLTGKLTDKVGQLTKDDCR